MGDKRGWVDLVVRRRQLRPHVPRVVTVSRPEGTERARLVLGPLRRLSRAVVAAQLTRCSGNCCSGRDYRDSHRCSGHCSSGQSSGGCRGLFHSGGPARAVVAAEGRVSRAERQGLGRANLKFTGLTQNLGQI